MKCKDARELMGPYLYGDLSADEMRKVRLHANECSECREDLVSRGRAIGAISTDLPTLTDEERQRIMWSVKGSVKNVEPKRSFRFRLAPALGIAALVLLAFGIGIALPHLNTSHHKNNAASESRVTVTEIAADRNRSSHRVDRNSTSVASEQNNSDKTDTGRALDPLRMAPLATSDYGPTHRSRPSDSQQRTVLPQEPTTVAPAQDKKSAASQLESHANQTGERLPQPSDERNAQPGLVKPTEESNGNE